MRDTRSIWDAQDLLLLNTTIHSKSRVLTTKQGDVCTYGGHALRGQSYFLLRSSFSAVASRMNEFL